MKKFNILIVLLIVAVLILGNFQVQAWSQQQKAKAEDEENRAKKIFQKRDKSKEEIQKEIKKVEEQLNHEVDPETGVEKELVQGLYDQIEQLQKSIEGEKDEKKKKEFEGRLANKKKDLQKVIKDSQIHKNTMYTLLDRLQNELNEVEEREMDKEIKRQAREKEIRKGLNLDKEQENDEEQKTEEDESNNIETQSDDNMMEWLQEWEQVMADFKVVENVQFSVPAKSLETVMQEISKPGTIKGAFFVGFENKHGVDLKITDPNGEVIQKIFAKKQGVFKFDATVPGTYNFIFNNKNSKKPKNINFAIDTNFDEFLQKEDIDHVEKQFLGVQKDVKAQLLSFKTLQRRSKAFNKAREGNATKIFVFTILETIFIVGTTIFQVMYIMKILDNKSFV